MKVKLRILFVDELVSILIHGVYYMLVSPVGLYVREKGRELSGMLTAMRWITTGRR